MKSLLKALLASVGLATLSGTAAIAQTDTMELSFAEALADTANWREVDPENLIVFDIATSAGETRGRVIIETAAFAAPQHVDQFKKIVRSGDFDGTIFHRVIDDFMAQGGDVAAMKPEAEPWPNIPGEFVFQRKPNDASDDKPAVQYLGEANTATNGYALGFPIQTQSEFLAALTEDGIVESWMPHCKGMVSTARTSDPNSGQTQFFLMRETSPHLDRQYTSWGRIISGQDVVDAIKTGEPVRRPDVLSKAIMASDMSEDERPRVLVQRTDGPLFETVLTENAGANVCTLSPVPAIVSY
ncbi:peptidylprolyl isomerase [Ponticaulis profundi]|uniref:peptidylprolyl isomerase n=1 Tax=Ponticaulis profundi TaxID=2665222 RepID=A0ABW1SEX6_9PROT